MRCCCWRCAAAAAAAASASDTSAAAEEVRRRCCFIALQQGMEAEGSCGQQKLDADWNIYITPAIAPNSIPKYSQAHRSCSALAASLVGRATSTNFSTQLILSGRPVGGWVGAATIAGKLKEPDSVSQGATEAAGAGVHHLQSHIPPGSRLSARSRGGRRTCDGGASDLTAHDGRAHGEALHEAGAHLAGIFGTRALQRLHLHEGAHCWRRRAKG